MTPRTFAFLATVVVMLAPFNGVGAADKPATLVVHGRVWTANADRPYGGPK